MAHIRFSKLKTRVFLGIFGGLAMFGLLTQTALAAGASFALSPATKNATVGEIFPISIILDTGGASASGASSLVLYEPLKLRVVEATGSAATKITVGTGTFVSPNVLVNTVDPTNGQVRLDLSQSTAPFTGKGTYGTFYLKPLAAGSTVLSFSFAQGGTTGSTVSSGTPPTNILSSVSGSTITINVASGSPTPAPLPVAGVETPTFILFFGGLGILGLGFFLLRPNSGTVLN